MLLLYANYTVIFWLLIGSNHADKVLLRQIADDQQTFGIASCTARCLQQMLQQQQLTQEQYQEKNHQHDYVKSTLEIEALLAQQKQQAHKELLNIQAEHYSLFQNCCTYCKRDNATTSLQIRQIQENLSLKLVCRDEKSLTFRINLAITTQSTRNEDNYPDNQTVNDDATKTANGNESNNTIIFVIKVHAAQDAKEYLVYLSDDNFFTIDGLKHNTTYAVTAIAVYTNNVYSVIAKRQEYTTLRRGFTPNMINDVMVLSYTNDKYSTKHLWANIEWKPSKDMNCDYDMICFSPENDEYDALPVEIREPRELYTYSVPNLTFSSEYKIGIRAKNRNNGKESALFWHTFRAPSCEEWFNYNFNICAPAKPRGLSVEQTYIEEDTISLNITWQKPEYMPDYYILRVLDLNQNGDAHKFNVTQDANTIFIPEIKITGILFEIHLTASTPGGNTTAYTTIATQTHISTYVADKNYALKLIFVIAAPVLCFVVLTLTSFIVYNRRVKLRRYQERCKYFEDLEKKAPIDPKTFDFGRKSLTAALQNDSENLTQFQRDLEEKLLQNDELEIDRNDLTLHEILGEGAFGLVRRGVYNQKQLGIREVAVKMLKDEPNLDEIRAFRHEIEVMKSVEQHPNIVSLIGHCTKQQGAVMLLTEFCSLGNLQSFLREEWSFLNELKNKLKKNSKAHSRQAKKLKINYFKDTFNLKQQQQQEQQNNNENTARNKQTTDYDAAAAPSIITNFQNGACRANYSNTIINSQKTNSVMQIEYISAATPSTTPHPHPALPAPASSSSMKSTTLSKINSATSNKSYGYDEFCTNACKCQVDVIINDIDHHNGAATTKVVDQLEKLLFKQKPLTTKQRNKIIAIRNCECRLRVKQAKNKEQLEQQHQGKTDESKNVEHSGPAVENEAYFINHQIESIQNIEQQQQHNEEQHQRQLEQEEINKHEHKSALTILAERQPLTAADLLDIAKQIALGMEYLGKNKVVHRDLAARNVLITGDRTIKIADFGLSRDIYQENIYKKTGNGKLPIKWLALESMTHQVYTTQSDVWSYGILLYEIVSLGGLPYPTIPANRLLHLLKSGYRMERPENCGPELYNMMHACWNATPTERPTFTEIINTIDELSEMAESQISYENIFSSAKNVKPVQKIGNKVNEANEDYLQPV